MKKRTDWIFTVVIFAVVLLLSSCAGIYDNAFDNKTVGRQKSSSSQVNGEKSGASTVMKEINVGWNLGNSLDAHYGKWDGTRNLQQELTWYNPLVTQELIDYVSDCGFNTIRIPVTWYYNTYRDKQGKLHIYEEWLQRVREVVDYAYANDMYVILNSHHDQEIIYVGTTQEDMMDVLHDANSLWSEIATYFKEYDGRLMFEGFNEVDNKACSDRYSELAASQLNALNQIFVNTVRESGGKNTSRILIVQTLFGRDDQQVLDGFTLPLDQCPDGLIVEVHDYSQLFTQDSDDTFKRLETFSKKVGAPVLIGEFGTTRQFVPADYREEHASNFVTRAAMHNIKCIWWDNGNSKEYGIINRKDYTDSNLSLIHALFEHKTYMTKEKNIVTYDCIDQFAWKQLDSQTGAVVDDIWWGSLVTDTDGTAFPIPEGADYVSFHLKKGADEQDYKAHKICFYDQNGQLLSSKEDLYYGFEGKTIEVPHDAAYIRICLYSIYRRTTLESYKNMFADKSMALMLSYLDLNQGIRAVSQKIG